MKIYTKTWIMAFMAIFAFTLVSCDDDEEIARTLEGTWQGDNITVDGVSQAGSHIEYKLTVTGNAVQGAEILSAEGEVEKQNVTMTIGHGRP
jgi:hypothetical protein